MKIYTRLEDIDITDKTAVALGNFDGIHIGHRVIMKSAIDAASRMGIKSLCFTFSNHPFNFILRRDDDDPAAVKLICSEEEKIELVRGLGFDILVNIPFDEHIMKMRAHDFFTDIIAGSLNAGFVSVGFNYTYGARAEGKPAMLEKECAGAGIGIKVQDAVKAGDDIVSSTLIRQQISAGNMEYAAELLGRPYGFSGMVGKGRKIGRTMGFPTINIPAPTGRMLPPNGVYFSRICIDGEIYNSISNIGVNPTVSEGNTEKTIETYIFDFERDVYGNDITVWFDHFERGEVRFPDREALHDQIARDCEQALEYHRKR